ncbi:MAG: high-potential iron-sulfur protein [Pseudomonadota bacterium]
MTKTDRRKFIQLSAVATAGVMVAPSRQAAAQDMPQLAEDDPMAQAMKYVHDGSSVDAASKPNPAPDQKCSNCALVQGADGDAWRPCQIFPGKLVNADGWCSVWAPKA